MRDLYLISGLGADKRVFDFLNLTNYNTHHIEWVIPDAWESIQQYAKRLSSQITTPNPIILGVSFGGMIAVEIAKQLKTEKIILISSAKSRKHIPSNGYVGKLKIHTLIPTRFIKIPNEVLFWLFGVETQLEKELLRSIMQDTDEKFFRWAIDKIVSWDNDIELENTIQIHGTKDRLIPFRSADYIIEGGGHLMIVNRAKMIESIITTILS